MTGHSANIFSVKFMPHSNDRTIVSCAGDSQVRVFDVEYSGRASNAPDISARSRRYNTFFNGVRYLNDGNTNTRVYRSHADRAKRIVTESSPHLFLTCSEDGEVRQWDLRQPSSAYPSPRGGQGFMSYRPGRHHDDSNVPPPLISYKRHHVDLNTISCAASQPHYIALGGAHLHCFLHDRRMMGRDLLAERGQMESPSSSTHDDEAMARATQCVRRFAPDGKKRMRRSDNGHITACKISNARPNEMIVSWSGDHIYSFDLISSPDARDSTEQGAQTAEEGSGSGRAKKIKTRKRKRDRAGASATSTTRANRLQSRRRPEGTNAERDMSFRVRYGNGNAEDIPFDALVERGDFSDTPEDVMERARESVMNDAQRLSLRIAKGLVEIRKLLFSFEASVRETAENEPTSDPTPFTPSFTSVLGQAATCLPEMDEVIRTWRYPLNPTRGDVLFQQALRRNRESSRRFVQASGTLARVLGGHLHTASEGESPQLELFRQIVPAPTENGIICPKAQFGYDFLKAILLWLEHGRQGMASGFTKTHVRRHDADRYPIPEGADENAIETYLIPYLQELAGDEPIVNVDASRFERDATRILFDSQPAGVRAFSEAIKIPLEDIGDAAAAFTDHSNVAEAAERGLQALDRRAAVNFWGLKVGRGLLMDAGEGVNFEFVNRAFGGLRTVVEEDGEDGDDGRERLQEDIDPNEEEEPISEVQLVGGPSRSERTHVESTTGEQGASDEDEASRNEDESEDSDNDADEHEDEEDEEDDEEDQDTDESDEEESGHPGVFLGRGPKRRETVESHVPCSSHMKVYQGHCNVKTVKDVNYYGLDDEYVVSGSDCGNFFIWDRKTSKLVNILSGDSDVVNVVQGKRNCFTREITIVNMLHI